MNTLYENMVKAAKNDFVKNFAMLKQDEEEQFFATLVKTYNRFCEDNGSPYERIYIIKNRLELIREMEKADEATFNELCKARSMGVQYAWQMGDGLQEIDLGTLAEEIKEEFEPLFEMVMNDPKGYADFLPFCFSVGMYNGIGYENMEAIPAPSAITINGKTYNKCFINDKQWDDVENPCSYCHKEVQRECMKHNNECCYCRNEHACYIDLGAIWGEQ